MFTITLDPRTNPDAAGEFLRSQFFVGEGLGCYSNFDWNPLAEKLPDSKLRADENGDWVPDVFSRRMKIRGITVVCSYWWDGDGNLAFHFPDLGTSLENSDCKSCEGWVYFESD